MPGCVFFDSSLDNKTGFLTQALRPLGSPPAMGSGDVFKDGFKDELNIQPKMTCSLKVGWIRPATLFVAGPAPAL